MCLSTVRSLRPWRGCANPKRGLSSSERAIAWQLVQTYLKHGDIAAAEEVCCRGGGIDTATWTAVIAANAEVGNLDRAIQLLDTMTGYGVVPDSVTFVTLLGACSRHHALDEGRRIHDRLKAAPLRHELKVANAVISMYAKCRAVSEAAHCFAALPSPDVVSWTVMVGLYANESSSRSMDMFCRMQQAGVKPNRVTFITVLRGCKQLTRGRMVHSLLDQTGMLDDVPTCNALLGMYSRCGSLKDAVVTFDLMQHRDVVTWTTMVAAQVQEGRHPAALLVYRQMLLDGGSRPSALSLSAALAACSCDLDSGRKLHAQAWEVVGDGDSDVAASLVSMYGRCRRPREARRAFEKVAPAERGRVLWNAMVSAHSDAGEHKQALDVFRNMQLECGSGDSDRITIVAALNACASLGNWTSGRTIYNACAGWTLAEDVMVATAAVNMYARCGKLSEARTVFDGIAVGSRDVVAWNAMVAAYAAAQQGREAVAVSRAMHCEGVRHTKPTLVSLLSSGCGLREGRLAHGLVVEAGMLDRDVVLATALLNMYAACGELGRAAAVFEAGRCWGDVVLWTSMVVAYEQAGKHDKALAVYAAMPVSPDSVAAVAALLAAGGLAALSAGREIHSKLPAELMADVRVGNALVAMYGKCGSPAEAAEVFGGMRSRDATSWGCLVGAFAAKGQGKAAVKALRRMRQEGWVPAQATIVAALAACSHDGMLEEGCHVFGGAVAATTKTPATIEMCGCVVDMLCRAGHLDKAEELIRSSRLASPNTVLWSTLLAACNVHGDVERGRRAAQELKRIDPKNDAPYVVLSTIVATAGCSS